MSVSLYTSMKELEEENNRFFIDAYGLKDELSPEVSDDQITLYRPDREEDIKRLLSYAIGCVMGRYSLDKPGLIYAQSGNKGFDPSPYKKFPPMTTASSRCSIPIGVFGRRRQSRCRVHQRRMAEGTSRRKPEIRRGKPRSGSQRTAARHDPPLPRCWLL